MSKRGCIRDESPFLVLKFTTVVSMLMNNYNIADDTDWEILSITPKLLTTEEKTEVLKDFRSPQEESSSLLKNDIYLTEIDKI